MNFEAEVQTVCAEIAAVLLEKRKAYGDSVFTPMQVFSRTDSVEQLKIAVDHKLARIACGNPDEQEDTELDLLGYLVLLRIAKRRAGLD